jgi:hypothetical protein
MLNKKILYLILLVIAFAMPVNAAIGAVDSLMYKIYNGAYCALSNELNSNVSFSFKKAVFIVENAYSKDELDYTRFCEKIDEYKALCEFWGRSNQLKSYKYIDSTDLLTNYSIFKFLKDTMSFSINGRPYYHLPFLYDFTDVFAYKDWRNMFVTKLMQTGKGNCHSLAYIYKILADELNAKCWLSLMPNHIYIKNRSKGLGWYNTELTNGSFPIDAWISTSGYVPLKAIQSGTYMDTLSNQQATALCVLDLAKGYEFQTRNYTDGFILKCCDLVLEYLPVNVQAILLKAETLQRIYEKQNKEKNVTSGQTYNEMEQLYVKLFDLGYREMPEKMYQQWLESLVKEKDKYTNNKLKLEVK